MSNRRNRVIILTLIVFVLPVLACNLFSRIAAPPATRTPVSTTEIKSMETQILSAEATVAAGGKVNLEFTEAQLTAEANTELQKQGESRIKDLKVGLQGGLVTLTGVETESGFDMPLTIKMKITIDQQGKPHTQVVSGEVGMFPLPEDMISQITSQVDQMITSQMQADGGNIFIESLTIANGKITIVAQVK
jgi:uncharacterized protein YpmS